MTAPACSAEVLALVEHLRLAGLSLGVDDHVRAQRIHAAVSALPEAEGRRSKERLRDALRAVLVRSPAHGDVFTRAFERVFAARAEPPPDTRAQFAATSPVVKREAPVPRVPSWALTAAVPVTVSLTVALALVLAVVTATRAHNEVAHARLRPFRWPREQERPGCRAVVVPGFDVERIVGRREEHPFRTSAAALAALGMALTVWGAWAARRGVRRYRDRFLPGPWSYRVPVAVHERAPVFSRSEVHRAAALLARAGDDDGGRVSWSRTIESTAQRGGFPTIVRARSTRAPVVGFVVDRSPGTARWRSSFEELLERLKRSGAPVRIWWSDGDPRVVRATAGPGASRALVSLRFEVDALVLVGEAREARRDWWPSLSRFERRLWLHPLPASRWDADARSLARVVPMAQASVDALAGLGGGRTRRGGEPVKARPPDAASPEALRAYLGPAFLWLCASAVASAPDLALAQVLGRRIGAKHLGWGDWLRLATLPHFDDDAWPQGLREALLAELTEAQRRTAQAWLLAKLTDAEGAPAEGSVAAMSRELHRIDLERALGQEVDAKRLGALLASPMRLAAEGLVPSASRGASMRYAGALSWRRVLPEVALAGVGVGALAASGEAARATVRIETVREARVPKPPRIVCDVVECPEGTVLIPAGEFLMGSADSDTLAQSNEKPQHRVRMSAYCIDRTEVTVAQYRAWSGSATNTPGTDIASCNWGHADRDNHPINCVDWEQASAFCTAHGGSLPTEAQWEYAARGSDGRVYPWGNTAPRDQLCWNGGGPSHEGTCPVGSSAGGRSPFGLDDMAGNVWEWTADYNRPYRATTDPPIADPIEPSSGRARGVRGGAWYNSSPEFVRAAFRFDYVASFRSDFLGFRCVRGSR